MNAQGSGFTEFWGGKVAGLITFWSAISDTDRNIVETNLMTRFGLS